MSFQYTPPPADIRRVGEIATYVLVAALVFVPNVRLGAIIGGLGYPAISFWVGSHAKGDLRLLSVFALPVEVVIGAIGGAAISFVSQTVWRFLRRNCNRTSLDLESEEDNPA